MFLLTLLLYIGNQVSCLNWETYLPAQVEELTKTMADWTAKMKQKRMTIWLLAWMKYYRKMFVNYNNKKKFD